MHGSRQFAHVILTQDWHPPGHSSFAGTHPGQQAFAAVDPAAWPDTLNKLADATGANARKITNVNGGVSGPVWSSTGDRIAFRFW